MLSAFRIRNFRFQYGADLLASWAFEMETLILGWFVLVTTQSPLLLSIFAALNFGGTLISPFFGVLADRVDRRMLLVWLRVFYTLLALVVMALGFGGGIEPWQIFLIAAVGGLIRPSDLIARNTLLADLVAPEALRNALGFSRTTMDSAKIVGALLGAGLFSSIGLAPAYGVVVSFYLLSVWLNFQIAPQVKRTRPATRAWAELRAGIRYMRRNQTIVPLMILAFLANLTAFPISHGLLPIVARDIFQLDANGLARLVALLALGAVIGAVVTATSFRGVRLGRVVIVMIIAWHLCVMVLGQVTDPIIGALVIFFVGLSQTLSMVSMSALLLSVCEPAYRGRVSGVRMLAVYGLPVGLVLGGALIESIGVPATFALYAGVGIAGTLAVAGLWPELLHIRTLG